MFWEEEILSDQTLHSGLHSIRNAQAIARIALSNFLFFSDKTNKTISIIIFLPSFPVLRCLQNF